MLMQALKRYFFGIYFKISSMHPMSLDISCIFYCKLNLLHRFFVALKLYLLLATCKKRFYVIKLLKLFLSRFPVLSRAFARSFGFFRFCLLREIFFVHSENSHSLLFEKNRIIFFNLSHYSPPPIYLVS